MTDQIPPSPITQESTAQQSQPVPQVPPIQTPSPVRQKASPFVQKLFPLLIVVGAIFFGAFVYYLIQRFTTKVIPPEVTTVIVTPTLIPTPFRYATDVSTSSGFIALEQSVSSFSAELAEFSKDDPALSPPNLVLPLGL